MTHGYGPTLPGTAVFMDAIAGVLRAAGLPDPMPAAAAAAYLDLCPPALQLPPRYRGSGHVRMRPTAGEPEPGETLPAGFASLPDRPIVYLTLGTITNQNPAVFRAGVEACLRLELNVWRRPGRGTAGRHPRVAWRADHALRVPVAGVAALRRGGLARRRGHHGRRTLPRAAATLPAAGHRPADERGRAGSGRRRPVAGPGPGQCRGGCRRVGAPARRSGSADVGGADRRRDRRPAECGSGGGRPDG